MNLIVNVLKLAIDELVRAKGIEGARVLDSVNRRGEIVIGVILPKDRFPAPERYLSAREAKRADRERR